MIGISRQAYYQKINRFHIRQEELLRVKEMVLELRMEMPRIGTRKMYYLLKSKFENNGIKLGRDGFFDYLRQEGLLIKPFKSYTKTTMSSHWLRKHPNLLKDKNVSRIEEVFVSDITYVKSRDKTHYLSLVTDMYSRKIVGYHLSDNMNSENVAKAIRMAIKNRKTNLPLIHHSDRGLQYCSDLYQKILSNNEIQPSMTDGYDCYQNALAERINGILKQEFLITKANNKTELNKMVSQSIKTYNSKRPHLSLNMRTPNDIHKKLPEASFWELN